MVKDTLKGYLGRPVVARVQLCIMAYDSVVSLQYEVKARLGGKTLIRIVIIIVIIIKVIVIIIVIIIIIVVFRV